MAFAHSEHDKPRYVASTGIDSGSCASAARPCRTIAYAALQSNKGDRILIAGGTYPIGDADELFYLTSGLLKIESGFSRYDHFKSADPARQRVTLSGVPPQFRGPLAERGFHVIADRKSLPPGAVRQSEKMLAQVADMSRRKAATECINGIADGLPCDNVDLLAHMPLADFSLNPSQANDIWGFTDLNTDREYAIIGLRNGVSVVDVTDPSAPVEIGSFGGATVTWRDVKVLQTYDATADRWSAYAYVTADGASDQLRIIDLRGLPNEVTLAATTGDFAAAHNAYLSNTDYSTGVPIDGADPALQIAGADVDQGVFRSYDLRNPVAPSLTATAPTVAPQFYMHDAASLSVTDGRKDTQCPNAGVRCQILADFNESTFNLWDITDSAAPVQISSTSYTNASYVHSGWSSEDGQYLFVHDELDEQQLGLNTTLRVFSLGDMTVPAAAGTWLGPTAAIDHNGFVRGNRYYMSNYTRGLTVLDITDPTTPVAVGRLDTFAPTDANAFSGAWGAYPYFMSGTIAISDIDSGLYLALDRTLSIPAGTFSFAAASAGASEGSAIDLTVIRTGGFAGAVSVDYQIIAASADDDDHGGSSGTLNWTDGDSAAKTISIPVVNDGTSENLERLFVRLINPQGSATLSAPATASAFLSDPGAAGEVEFLATELAVEENSTQTVVTAVRRGLATGTVSVDYSVGGTATMGADVNGPASGTFTWADGDASARNLVFNVVDDSDAEDVETIEIALSNASGAAVGAAGTAKITIASNDNFGSTPPPTGPPAASGGGGGTFALVDLLVLLIAWRRKLYSKGSRRTMV